MNALGVGANRTFVGARPLLRSTLGISALTIGLVSPRLVETVRRWWSFGRHALFFGCAAIAWRTSCFHAFCEPLTSRIPGPAPLASGDADRDGLLDSEEQALALRYAPLVVLHAEDTHHPASAPWLRARSEVFQSAPRKMLAGSFAPESSSRRVPPSAQTGSRNPEDWTTYVHVYPRADGGVNVQYWFFYPYSNGPLFFDHDSDWEHVTLELDSERRAVGAELAQHENDHPGHRHAWSELEKQGDHVVIYSARGTHASYAGHATAAWFEQTATCVDGEHCSARLWKTWQAGGLENLGERSHPLTLDPAFGMRERWGSTGFIPGTSAPYGPLYHRGYCVDGVRACRDAVRAPDALGLGNSGMLVKSAVETTNHITP